jgi:NTP pyrophosphatase (non-canonical NTP hydrolase)
MQPINHVEELLATMSLDQIQAYMQKMAQHRGFAHDPSSATMLILLEEVGELAKALRKHTGLKIDHTRIDSYGSVAHEMADVLICLLLLANNCNINLFGALAEKEAINKQRTWTTAETTHTLDGK